MKSVKGTSFQQGLFTLLLNNERFFESYFKLLRLDYFPLQLEKIVFKLIGRYVEEYESAPKMAEFVLFAKEVQRYMISEVLNYLEGLPSYESTDEGYYIQRLGKFVQKAEMHRAVQNSEEDIANGNFQGLIDRVMKAQSVSVSAEAIPQSFLERFGERCRFMTDHFTTSRVPTGFETIDEYTWGGLKYGQVGLVAADYGLGKSIFLMNVARTAFYHGKKVLFITLACELDQMEQETRLDCLISRVPIHEYEGRTGEIASMLKEVAMLGGDVKFVEWNDLRNSIDDIHNLLAILARKKWFPDVVVIDYLDLISPRDDYDTGHEEVENIWRDFKTCAKQNRFVGWSASQLNSDEELAKSKAKRGVIDFGLKLLQTPPEREAHMARGVCIKNRNGIDTFIMSLNKNGGIFEFTETGMDYEQHKAFTGLDEYWKQQRQASKGRRK